jgi:hypothetical protein
MPLLGVKSQIPNFGTPVFVVSNIHGVGGGVPRRDNPHARSVATALALTSARNRQRVLCRYTELLHRLGGLVGQPCRCRTRMTCVADH